MRIQLKRSALIYLKSGVVNVQPIVDLKGHCLHSLNERDQKSLSELLVFNSRSECVPKTFLRLQLKCTVVEHYLRHTYII